jgi:predicted nucleotidyltransferase
LLELANDVRSRGLSDMVAMDSIQEMTEQIVQEFRPKQIILFGSYAYGTPTADSDADLLVILPFEGKAPRKSHAQQCIEKYLQGPNRCCSAYWFQ